ncbi:MAG: DUF2268 domain-containing protein [Oscillochloris sp.]|nr:DUF2268 domain-containing protein [Oscillochloris sp.]
MHIQIIDTAAIYERLLASDDPAVHSRIVAEELAAPFAEVAAIFGQQPLDAFAIWGLRPEQFAAEHRAATAAKISALAEANAWSRAAAALERAKAPFEPYREQIGLDRIIFALLVGEATGTSIEHGYTGFGGIPGWVMTIYSAPNPANLARVEACTAHELHHNLRFRLFAFNPISVTVGEYMIAEGLAEAYAAELYGDDSVGPWVSEFDESRLDAARSIIGAALDRSGFAEVRGHIFGDAIARDMGLPVAGVPDFAGYALGYKVVRAYQARTGNSVAAATMLPAHEIIAESRFFA